jgi:hypothetical protein
MRPVLLATLRFKYWLLAVAGGISLVTYVGLILVPAISSYGRLWEKVAAGFLTLFVLAALVVVGIGAGLAIVLYVI